MMYEMYNTQCTQYTEYVAQADHHSLISMQTEINKTLGMPDILGTIII